MCKWLLCQSDFPNLDLACLSVELVALSVSLLHSLEIIHVHFSLLMTHLWICATPNIASDHHALCADSCLWRSHCWHILARCRRGSISVVATKFCRVSLVDVVFCIPCQSTSFVHFITNVTIDLSLDLIIYRSSSERQSRIDLTLRGLTIHSNRLSLYRI